MKHLTHIIRIIGAAMLLTACSADENAEPDALLSDAPVQMVGLTRAASSDAALGDIKVILAYGSTTTEGLFQYSDESAWSTQLKLKSGSRTYQMYGYMPDDGLLSSSLSYVSDDEAVLRLQGLQPITEQDYCILTGIRQTDDAEDKTAATRGNFSFLYASNRQNYINLFFDHLLSHVEFRMKVGTDYNTVRSIRIKRMKLKIANASQVAADITLTDEVGISSVGYSVTETDECLLTIKNEEQNLTTLATAVGGAYLIPAPSLLGNLLLVTEYDVYDKQGNKIAERTATNKLAEPLNELQRGEDRTLLITVEPSYLYVLSDADLDNPPFVVE